MTAAEELQRLHATLAIIDRHLAALRRPAAPPPEPLELDQAEIDRIPEAALDDMRAP